MEKSELEKSIISLLLLILVYFIFMLFLCGFDIEETLSHCLLSMIMGTILYKIFGFIFGFISGIFELGVGAVVLTKQTYDQKREEEKRALQAKIDEMVRQDQIKREKIINSYEYKQQQQREKRIEDARRDVRRLTEELANIRHFDERTMYEKKLKEAVDRLETLERAEKAFKHIDLP
jgi:hypothetical protein